MRWKPLVLSSFILTAAAGPVLGQESKDKGAEQRGGRTSRSDSAPKVGDEAPTFKLKSLDGKDEFDLAGFRGKKPVVLFFGSYT